jgi:hypothetical protein
MELPVIENTYRCSIRQSISGKLAVNVVHVRTTSSEDAEDVGNAVAQAWGHDDGPCKEQSTGVTLSGVDVTPLDGVSPTVSVTFGLADNQAGQHSAFTMPAGDVMCVGLKSAKRGRRFNGRLFFSGLCTNQAENNQQAWLGATATALQAELIVFRAQLSDAIAGTEHVVATYGFNPITEETWEPEANEILTYSPSVAIASQRRRDR